jgi:hypothetical protein
MMRSQLSLGALALVLGFGIAAVPRLLDDGGDARLTKAARGNPRAILTAPTGVRSVPTIDPIPAASASEAPAAPATSPGGAVQAFLRAEADRDFATSYGLLAADDRAAQRSRAGWTAAHAQLPVVRDFTVGAVRESSARAEVDTRVVLRPELGPVVGLVPATATATWIAVAEHGGWRVSFAESTLVPEYTETDAAPDAARAWVEDRHGCPARARAALFASTLLIDELCDARGRARVGSAQPLEPGESSDALLAAYGPDVFTWAQVVPVTSPARVGAVLAPLGPRWRVIGLVDLPSAVPSMQLTSREGAQP